MSYPSSSPQEMWSFLLLRCPEENPYFLIHLSTSRRPSFQPRAPSPIPSTTCQGFKGQPNILRSQQLANLHGNKSQELGKAFEEIPVLPAALESSWRWSWATGIATSGSG